MSAATSIALERIMPPTLGSVDPSTFPDEEFDLYSIPAFDQGEPEVLKGSAIGSAKQIVQPADVLLSRIVPHIRRAWVVGDDRGRRIIASGEWIVFRGENIEPRYLRHVLVGDPFHAEFMRTVSGVGGSLLRARPAYVAKIKIPLPSLPEQRRIAAILDKADELRAKRRAAIAQLDILTQSIFLDMFGDPAINPNSVGTKQLGDYLVFLTSGGRGWAKYYASTGDRFIRSLDVQMNHIENKEAAYVSAPENAEARRTRVQVGDVLLTITGSRIGRVAPVTAELEGSFVSQHVAILRVDADRINPKFLSFFLSLESGGQRQIAKAQYGQTKPGLNFEQIQRFQVPIPAVEQQREFISRMAAVEKIKTSQLISVADLDALFTSLQHRAFRGEL